MAPQTIVTTTTTILAPCNPQPVPLPRTEVLMTATSAPAAPAALPARVPQRFPLWLITDPHTTQEARWLVVAWERQGDLLAAAVVAEDQDMTYLRTWPLYLQDGDLISTTPDARAPQAPPSQWAITTDGFEDDGALFWVTTGWTWSGGKLEPVTTIYDAEDLDREGLGVPAWSTKRDGGSWLEGYVQGWRWDAGQLTPIYAVENAASLDAWDSAIAKFARIER